MVHSFQLIFVIGLILRNVANSATTNSSDDDQLELIKSLFNSTSAYKPLVNITDDMPAYATSLYFGSEDLNNSTRKKLITVLLSINYHGSLSVESIGSKAIELALDRLRKQPNWLPGYELAFELIDDQCLDEVAVPLFVDQMQRNDASTNRFPVAVITACATQGTLAESLSYYNFTGFASLQNSPDLQIQRGRYRSFFGLGETGDLAYVALTSFISKIGWKQIAVLSEINSYYNTIEPYFFQVLPRFNITLAWYGKVTPNLEDADEMSTTLQELKKREQRIIFLDVTALVSAACWFHRFRMYGPSYALFIVSWAYFPPKDAVIPDYISSWCTKSMVGEVLEGAFSMGDSSLFDVKGPLDAVDSTGLTGEDFTAALKEKIVDAETGAGWQFGRTMYYDSALYVGFLLNKTESLLSERNETLSDWIVASDKFKENGEEIVKTIEKAVYSTHVVGFKGVYDFEESTTVNSQGYTPVTIVQIQNALDLTTVPDQILVAMYQSNRRPEPLSISREKVQWRTRDGLPPRDHLVILPIEDPLIPVSVSGTLLTIGSVLFLSSVVFGVIIAKKNLKKNLTVSTSEIGILAGNVIMACHVYALPVNSKMNLQITSSCMAIYLMLALGYSTSMCSIFCYLMQRGAVAKRQGSSKNNSWKGIFPSSLTRSNESNNSILPQQSPSLRVPRTPVSCRSIDVLAPPAASPVVVINRNAKIWVAFNVVWFFINAGLIGAAFAVQPLETRLVNGTLNLVDKRDASVAYQPFTFECTSSGNALNLTALTIGCIFGFCQAALLLRTALLAYKIRANKIPSNAELGQTCTSLYCVVLIFVGTAFLVLLLGSRYILLILSCTALIYVVIVNSLVFLIKLFNAKNGKKPPPGSPILVVTASLQRGKP